MSKRDFKVWDSINGSEDTCGVFEAVDAEEAAELYADEDVDGSIDNIYSSGHPIHVRDADGVLHEVEVTVDYCPTFSGRLVKPSAPLRNATNSRCKACAAGTTCTCAACAADAGCDCCDECDGSGVVLMSGEPRACICNEAANG